MYLRKANQHINICASKGKEIQNSCRVRYFLFTGFFSTLPPVPSPQPGSRPHRGGAARFPRAGSPLPRTMTQHSDRDLPSTGTPPQLGTARGPLLRPSSGRAVAPHPSPGPGREAGSRGAPGSYPVRTRPKRCPRGGTAPPQRPPGPLRGQGPTDTPRPGPAAARRRPHGPSSPQPTGPEQAAAYIRNHRRRRLLLLLSPRPWPRP